MNWDRVNVWTRTLYVLIHSLRIAKDAEFDGNRTLDESVRLAKEWVLPDCSYASVLLDHPFGRRKPIFRRDPNKHFDEISRRVVKMLVQDLVRILDEMMDEALVERGERAGKFPQSKIQKLTKSLDQKYLWASHGCLELVAARNALTHGGGKWGLHTIAIVAPFMKPLPNAGDHLSVGVPMLFRYRKAMRTFLNEIAP